MFLAIMFWEKVLKKDVSIQVVLFLLFTNEKILIPTYSVHAIELSMGILIMKDFKLGWVQLIQCSFKLRSSEKYFEISATNVYYAGKLMQTLKNK